MIFRLIGLAANVAYLWYCIRRILRAKREWEREQRRRLIDRASTDLSAFCAVVLGRESEVEFFRQATKPPLTPEDYLAMDGALAPEDFEHTNEYMQHRGPIQE